MRPGSQNPDLEVLPTGNSANPIIFQGGPEDRKREGSVVLSRAESSPGSSDRDGCYSGSRGGGDGGDPQKQATLDSSGHCPRRELQVAASTGECLDSLKLLLGPSLMPWVRSLLGLLSLTLQSCRAPAACCVPKAALGPQGARLPFCCHEGSGHGPHEVITNARGTGPSG